MYGIIVTQDVDYSLARAAEQGIVTAVGDLYERHRRRVYSLCLRMTGSREEAEDLTQEVFIQLLRKVGSFRGESQFSTWLYRLTVNQVLMHFRRTVRQREDVRCELELAIPKTLRVSEVTERIALEKALARLPAGSRAIFLMFAVAGYNHREIANIFGCSIGNSKSQLHKARKKLKRLLTV